jgi:microcompartment protein CcmK/EutM
MRISRVIGQVVLNRALPDVPSGRLLVVRTCNRGTLAGSNEGNDETLVMYDEISAGEGDLVGLVEGREATNPFYPGKVPFDCYNACILDDVQFQPVLEVNDAQ